MKTSIINTLVVLASSQTLMAGTVGGGGGVPAKEALALLMIEDPRRVGLDVSALDENSALLLSDSGTPFLGVRSANTKTLVLQRSLSVNGIRTLDVDFGLLNSMALNHESIDVKILDEKSGATKSGIYKLEPGDSIDEVTVTDLRTVMRNSSKNSSKL